MNIKNRINKLQKLTNVGGGFCICPGTRKVETYWADLGIESNDLTPQLYGSPVADTCSLCRKPIKKEQIIIQGVDHMTKDRFPEEWESSK